MAVQEEPSGARRRRQAAIVPVPTIEDYREFDGGYSPAIWAVLWDEWRCPSCDRTKFQIMRWTKRFPAGRNGGHYMGWQAAFAVHHDHGSDRFGFGADGMFLPRGPERFEKAIICDHCNGADGAAKRKLDLLGTTVSSGPTATA